MVHRQAAEPAVAGVHAEVERRADRAPQVVAVGEAHRARAPRGAARQDPAVQGIEVVLPQERQVGLAHRHVVGLADHERRLRTLDLGVELARRQPGVERVDDGAELHQGVERDHVLEPRRLGDDDVPTAAHSPRGETARAPRRLRLELLVGQLDTAGDQGHPVGAGLGALGEPVVEDHLADAARRSQPGIIPNMPIRHKQAPPSRTALCAHRVAQRGRVRGHPVREGRRDREDHHQPARRAERLPPPDAGRAPRRLQPRPRRPRRRLDHLHRGRRPRRSAPAVTSGSAATTATSATTRSLSRAWDASTSATSTSRSAASRSRWWRWSRDTPSGGGHILHLVCDLTIAG